MTFSSFGVSDAHIAPQFGQQFVLDDISALHDQLAFGSIHFAGSNDETSIIASCQKWQPAPSAFVSRREKSGMHSVFCKRLTGVKAALNHCRKAWWHLLGLSKFDAPKRRLPDRGAFYLGKLGATWVPTWR
jgi:hypothetical protein